MTNLLGTADWQDQPGGPIAPLGQFAVNTSTNQSFNLESLILPTHGEIWVFWIAALASVGAGMDVTLSSDLNSVVFGQRSTLFDGANVNWAIPASYITENAAQLILTATVPPASATPVQGTLVVFALSRSPLVTVTQRLEYRGIGKSADTSTAAGGTNTPLPGANPGYYHRVRGLSVRVTGTPAAAGTIVYRLVTDATSIVVVRVGVVADFWAFIPLDFSTIQGIQCTNNLSVACGSTFAWEDWPV